MNNWLLFFSNFIVGYMKIHFVSQAMETFTFQRLSFNLFQVVIFVIITVQIYILWFFVFLFS